MKKFDYHIEVNVNIHTLKTLGQKGYELISITRDGKTGKHWFYFKKEIIT